MVSIEVNKEIRRAVDTGKVEFGWRSTERNILKGNGKLVILSSNAPLSMVERARHLANVSELHILDFSGTGKELGSVCGKPFVVSIMTVQDTGKSNVLDLIEQQKEKPKAVHKRKRK